MKTRAWGIAIVVLGVRVLGAQEGSPYEQALHKVVESFEKIGVSLKTIVDEDSAKAAKPELKKAATIFLDARARAEKLEPPEKDEKLRLEKIFKAKLEDAMRKMNLEARRVELIPGGREALKEISSVLQKNGK